VNRHKVYNSTSNVGLIGAFHPKRHLWCINFCIPVGFLADR